MYIGGGILGVIVAALRTAPSRIAQWSMIAFIELFQGTPVLMQLFVAYYGLSVLLDVNIDPWPAVTIALTLHAAAFLGEIWRGSIEAIPVGQWEAAKTLGLGRIATLRLIILPQALRISMPATVGFLVQLIKSTAIASIIGFVEVTRAGQLMSNVTFQPLTIYPIVAGLYFILCWPLSLLSQHMERRMDIHVGGPQYL